MRQIAWRFTSPPKLYRFFTTFRFHEGKPGIRRWANVTKDDQT